MKDGIKIDKLAEAHARLKDEEIQCDVLQDILREYQNKIPEEDILLGECQHTPDLLLAIDTIEQDDHRKVLYQCQACGETIEDIQPLDEYDMK